MSWPASMRRCANGRVFSCEVLSSTHGYTILQIKGRHSYSCFKHESGGHRWQRVSPTERRGRVHTSTVTVAVFEAQPLDQLKIDPNDLEWKTTRGSGAGGQHRNTTDSAVQLKHKPSGVRVRCESERSQHQNKATALQLLHAKLQTVHFNTKASALSKDRKLQVGSGMRADKIRTYREQDDSVKDHRTGKQTRLSMVMRGDLGELR